MKEIIEEIQKLLNNHRDNLNYQIYKDKLQFQKWCKKEQEYKDAIHYLTNYISV